MLPKFAININYISLTFFKCAPTFPVFVCFLFCFVVALFVLFVWIKCLHIGPSVSHTHFYIKLNMYSIEIQNFTIRYKTLHQFDTDCTCIGTTFMRLVFIQFTQLTRHDIDSCTNTIYIYKEFVSTVTSTIISPLHLGRNTKLLFI